MNIVVTGGAGYIGSMLCKKLSEETNFKIKVFDNFYYDQENYVKSWLDNENITFYKEDILEWGDNLVNEISNADFIIPLAAIVGAPACDKVSELAYNLNYRWYEDLLELLTGSQKLIYPNTNSGYGTTPEGTICTEETPSNPISYYGKLKQETEELLLENYKYTVVFRLATVFGLSGRTRMDLLVNNFVYRALKYGKLDIFDGHFRRNFISVNDVCDAFIFAINNYTKMLGNVYNLGTDSLNCTKIEFAKKIQEVTGCDITEHENKTDPDKRDYLVSNKKLYDLGFDPKDIELKFKAEELYNFCKTNKITDNMFNY